MATQAQIDANRRNALKSTGPKTDEGKARSSRNATTFGLYTKEVLLPREDAEQLKAIRDDAFKRLDPIGQTEALYVERFVSASWRLRRALAGESKLLTSAREANNLRDAAEVYTFDEATKHLDKIQRQIASLERAMDRALRELRRLQKDRSERQNEEIEPNFESDTASEPPLAGSLATRSGATNQATIETTNSNPIASTDEAAQHDIEDHDDAQNRKFKPKCSTWNIDARSSMGRGEFRCTTS